MKTFRFFRGDFAGSTITVKELREALSEFPEDMPVMVEWEGCRSYIDLANFSTYRVSKGFPADECEVLMIDVNNY